MRKIILILIICFVGSFALQAKSDPPSVRKTMKMFKGEEDVEYMSIPVPLIRGSLPEEIKVYKKILRKIRSVAIMSYDGKREEVRAKITVHMRRIVNSKKMAKLIEVNAGGEEFHVMCRNKKGKVKELFLYLEEDHEINLIHVKANIPLKILGTELSKLIQDKELLEDLF